MGAETQALLVGIAAAGPNIRNPSRATLPGCCASVACGAASRLRMSMTIHPTVLYHMIVSPHQLHAGLLVSMEGRDKSAARTTLGGEFPALALSIGEVGASFHPGPRFRRPPCDPGQWAFPSPVLTLASLWSPSHTPRSFSADSHPPRRRMVCFHGHSMVPRPYHVRLLLELPSAQSPFACSRCYLVHRGL